MKYFWFLVFLVVAWDIENDKDFEIWMRILVAIIALFLSMLYSRKDIVNKKK